MLLKYYSVIRISELGKWYENKKRLKKNEMERKIVLKDNIIEARNFRFYKRLKFKRRGLTAHFNGCIILLRKAKASFM